MAAEEQSMHWRCHDSLCLDLEACCSCRSDCEDHYYKYETTNMIVSVSRHRDDGHSSSRLLGVCALFASRKE